MSKELVARNKIIYAWRQNVFAAEHGGELERMEGLYIHLDRERKCLEDDNLSCGWNCACGEPDKSEDLAREAGEGTTPFTWGHHRPSNFNKWARCTIRKRQDRQQANRDKKLSGVPNGKKPEQASPPLPKLGSSYADILKANAPQRSYTFARVGMVTFSIGSADPH